MPAQQAKHWCFTINNYNNDDKQSLLDVWESTGHSIVYMVYGEEVGETGTPHLQGFISYSKRTTFNKVKEHVGSRAHIEQAKGTPAQAATYCKKDNAYTEVGILPGGQGKRSDLLSIQEAIKGGATKAELRDQFFGTYVRYERAINNYVADVRPVRQWECNVIVNWGKTGTGKTRNVYDFHNVEEIYSHPGERWFDGYSGQPVVLFDDFNGSEFPLTYLLKLLDRYPMRVPVKGSYEQWIPKVIYFTSNKNPDDWYPNAFEEHRNALKRRLTKVNEFK